MLCGVEQFFYHLSRNKCGYDLGPFIPHTALSYGADKPFLLFR